MLTDIFGRRRPRVANRLGRSRRLLPAACLASAMMGFGSWSAPATAQDLIAVTGHFLHHSRFYPQYGPYWRVDLTLPLVKELGVKTVHEAIYSLEAPQRALISGGKTDPATLRIVEENRRLVGQWLSTYDASGVKVVLAVLGLPPKTPREIAKNTEMFAWVTELVAAHPSVIAVQMHNEANLPQFWKATPEEYVDTYRPLAQAIKARRPDVRIVGGAISSLWWGPGIGWLKRAVDHGLLDFADSIAVHPYNVDSPPEVDPHWRGAPVTDPDQREKALQAFWKQIEGWNKTGKRLDLFFTEFGWNTATTGRAHVDEATQADYLARSFLIFQDVRLKGVPLRSAHWYDLKDDGEKDDKGEHRYGLVSYDLTRRKPAFQAMKALNAYFGQTDAFEVSKRRVEVSTPGAPVKVKSWRRKSDGAEVIAFWSTGLDGVQGGQAAATLRIDGIKAATGRLFFADERKPQSINLKAEGSGSAASVEATSRPQWIELPGR